MTTDCPAATVRLSPRVLYLTADTHLVRRQLERGETLEWDPNRRRMQAISTDEITPAWVCFHYDETLGDYVYVGLRDDCVGCGQVRRFAPSVVVSGGSKGCGSSREASPYAELAAGVRLVIADSFEKIYRQNAINIGLLTSTDLNLIPRVLAGESIPLDDLTRDLDPISQEIVRCGGLAGFNLASMSGRSAVSSEDAGEATHTDEVSRSRRCARPTSYESKRTDSRSKPRHEEDEDGSSKKRPGAAAATPRKPMNLVEKLIARSVVSGAAGEEWAAVSAVSPGDALFIRADVRFSHEYVTAMAASIFERGFGEDAKVAEPSSCFLFRDHLTFLGEVMPEHQKRMGLLERAEKLAARQESFARTMGIRLFGEVEGGGSEAICHNAIVEEIGLPGQVIVGTDSHTCTAGALGALGFGVGSTDMAAAWYTRRVRVEVPESVRVRLVGELPPLVTAKDIVLRLMTEPYVAGGGCVGRAIEYAGPGLLSLSMDERATLANMAVEAGAFTGIMEADEVTFSWLARQRPGLDLEAVRAGAPTSDADAAVTQEIEIHLGSLEPMVACPGSPRDALPLSRLESRSDGPVKIDIAYGGSCTGGKTEDMDMYARILQAALRRGQRVAPGVDFFIQYGSQRVKRHARERGYPQLFERVGARTIEPSCGACIGAGPGVSLAPETVTIAAINRNFPGRSGPGEVYLASPLVVAASALTGRISTPEPNTLDN